MQGVDVSAYSGLTCDSRHVKPGMIFAALPGTVADGRDYIDIAIANGAKAVLTTADVSGVSVDYIASENPRLDYARLAAEFYPEQPDVLVAMTGTNGKSSSVEFLRQIWAQAGRQAACFGTLGVQGPNGYSPMTHTTPDAVALHKTLSSLVKEGVTHAAMEASSHGLKQYRLDAAKVSVAGFSNLTQDHFDYHPDMEDYFLAKARLFTELVPADGRVVINVNDVYGQRLADMCAARGQSVMQVGWTGCDIHIDELMPRGSGQRLDICLDGEKHRIDLPLAGEFQALNAVMALGLALATDVKKDVALAALEQLSGVAGRMERVGTTQEGAPVFVDFAHTEDGLEKLLRSLRPHVMGRMVLVFGCGGDRDPDKRAKMGAVAAKLADHVIVTDDNPRTEDPASIRKAVMAGCPSADEIGDRADAIRAGLAMLQKDDCLIIAGKGHEQGQIVGDQVIPFCDKQEAQAALKEAGYA